MVSIWMSPAIARKNCYILDISWSKVLNCDHDDQALARWATCIVWTDCCSNAHYYVITSSAYSLVRTWKTRNANSYHLQHCNHTCTCKSLLWEITSLMIIIIIIGTICLQTCSQSRPQFIWISVTVNVTDQSASRIAIPGASQPGHHSSGITFYKYVGLRFT